MLGRLIQTAASYGKGSAALESATEEAHTRNLLYGQSQNVYTLTNSPPTSPFGGPAFRPGSFDDRGGLELDEKDLRILIAQDAYGAEEKPTVLYDSQTPVQASSTHARHASTAQLGQRSPLPNDWRPGPASQETGSQSDLPFRNRSATLTNAPSAWGRPVRDAGTREEAFLECMFGVTSSTKATSTIKMHIVPGKPGVVSPGLGRGANPSEPTEQANRRAPLGRSRTSNIVPRAQSLTSVANENDTSSHDVVLITRLFHIALTESVGTTVKEQRSSSSGSVQDASSAAPSPSAVGGLSWKKPKLVERKVPAFAIGLVLYLNRAAEPRSTRPNSQSAHTNPFVSPPGSYGSDIQNAWTFLNAIPESLAASKVPADETDKRVELIVNNWDVILRAISVLERESILVLREQLERNLNQIVENASQPPKEKAMQRINQRIISITDPAAVARRSSLQRAAKHALLRVCYALRIPRVVTGLGFAAGHWSDEARILYRVCGRRQQNFFLFNLLTAFLGQHTSWLQRLAPDWYRKQSRIAAKKRPEHHTLACRTVLISDQRAIARRLIFVLASFLPGLPGLDGLQKPADDHVFSGHFSTSSPSSQITRNESLRRTANRRVRESRLQPSASDKAVLSTSASSTDSTSQYPLKEKSTRYLGRRDSDAMSIKNLPVSSLADSESQLRKASLASTVTMTPYPATPVALFSTRQESYFPEGAIADTHESVASADLAKILRRSSSSTGNTSNMSSRWGSLVSGISDIWSAKPTHSGMTSSIVPSSPAESHAERRSTHLSPSKVGSSGTLQDMVNQVGSSGNGRNVTVGTHQSMSPATDQSPFKALAGAPRLKVDDKDGVVDVDLDLPGFTGFQIESLLASPSKRTHRPSTASVMDGTESVRGLRSIPNTSLKAPVVEESGVAGFLRRHHEDFTMHAVRPYPDLESEIKRTMTMEPSPTHDANRINSGTEDEWCDICTTLVADVRAFSIRRITLRRKLRCRSDASTTSGTMHPESQAKMSSAPNLRKIEQIFVEEEVKDFDTMLADAVERVLNLTEALQPTTLRSPRMGHTRSASTSTTVTSRSTNTPLKSVESGLSAISHDYVRQDCRQVVLGALEEVVKDVSDELDKQQKGRDIGDGTGNRSFAASLSSAQRDVKQENMLREGIKKWLVDIVEQTKAW